MIRCTIDSTEMHFIHVHQVSAAEIERLRKTDHTSGEMMKIAMDRLKVNMYSCHVIG